MTAKEQATLKRLQSRWAQGTATRAQMMRCMELEQQARAHAAS